MVIDANSRISLSNNDSNTGNTVFGKSAFNTSTDNASDYNTVIGELAMGAGTGVAAAIKNVTIGYKAATVLVSGDANSIIGYQAGLLLQTGISNVVVGYQSLAAAVDVDKSVAIGDGALGGGVLTAGAGDGTGADGTIAIGYSAGYNLSSGSGNTVIGFEALDAEDDGDFNTAVGYQALTAQTGTSGFVGNTAVGYKAAVAITKGRFNTIMGRDALFTDDVGDGSTAIGYAALYSQNSDSDNEDTGNTGVGYYSGLYNVTGTNNTYLGWQSGKGASGQSNSGNVGVGANALLAVTDGSYNVVIGETAALALNTGCCNVVIGRQAGSLITDTNNCVIIGHHAGDAINHSDSGGAIAIGYNAMGLSTTAVGNTAVGFQALMTNTKMDQCTAIGYGALELANYTSGDENGYNTAVGYYAGRYIATGQQNTFVGTSSGRGITGNKLGGNDNTAVGFESGLELEGAAHSNTFLGSSAGSTTEAGVENTCLGFNCDAEDDTATNQIVIGNNVTGTADNAVHIGNDTSHIRCDFNSDQTWDASSDRRQKKDIEESELGLDFINDLKPSKYRHKSPSEFPEEWKAHDPEDKSPMGGSDKYYYGFIAQEVKEAIDKHDASDYGAWNADEDGRQRVSREQFVVSLVKAVQELTAKVEALEAK